MASMPDPVGRRDPSPSFAPGVQLTLMLKGQLVQTYSFDSSDVVVGRDPYCAVYIDNPGVSREHFKISRGDTGEFKVVDLGSSNGTYLNDKPIKAATLRDGDVIQFSKYTMKVSIDELVGGHSMIRKPDGASEGATVMLSPSEVRQMVADARNKPAAGAAPNNIRPINPNAAHTPNPSPSSDSSPNRMAALAWLIGAAVVGAAAAIWIFAHR